MAGSILNKVAVIGMGCTKFGERWDKGADDLIVDAFTEAIEDAGIEKKDIEAAWLGTCMEDIALGRSGLSLNMTLKMPFTPVTRVENFCATGTEAFRGACYAVASGACDIAMAIGVDKLKDTGYGGLPAGGGMGTRNRFIFPNQTAPGQYATMATKYFDKYGIGPEDGKKMLASVSVKSHRNAKLSPKAHLRNEITIEQAIKAPIIAWPLGLFDCCGVSDGAACAIVARPELARKLRPDPVYVKALQIAASSGEELMYNNWDGAHVEAAYRAGMRAYQEAGIKNPREELSLLEVHDCFSITELTVVEDLQISQRGKAGEDMANGFYDLDGQIPCQADGGLKCFGHPVGATGLRQIYEVYKQMQGKAGPRQIKNPKLGLTHNMGGYPSFTVVSVAILGN